ncbi:MAG: 3-isopropylmalate dehydratase small subunit, partial [Lachnospiraceae bacterium]|nr:3-isopropylmalate dehydratase small subunit [Lachnospiraceae bacterium]
MEKAKGHVHTFGEDVNTDVILPGKYLNVTDPDELASHCMESWDPEFPSKVTKGDVIVARKNVGCGSSREHAPLAILYAGVSCVIADSFARIF